MNQEIEKLRTQVARDTDVKASAVILLNGIAARIKTAVDQAIANGATAEELVPLTELNSTLQTSTDSLAAAVQANTPA
jgi:hypothetical protein